MDKKKVFTVIGIILELIAIIKISIIGIYPNEIVLYFGILVIGLIFLMIAKKTKATPKGSNGSDTSLSDKWKCNCGTYNNQNLFVCGNCSEKKPFKQN